MNKPLIEFCRVGTEAVELYCCGTCGQVFKDRDRAWKCHRNCCKRCGEMFPIPARPWASTPEHCPPCRSVLDAEWRERSERRERTRYEKAKKVAWADYGDQPIVYNDNFFYDLDDLYCSLDVGDDEPEWAFATKWVPLQLRDAESLLGAAHEWDDHCEESCDSWAEVEKLKKFVIDWNGFQTGGTWHEDPTRVVILPKRDSDDA